MTHPCGKFHHVRGKGSVTTWWGVESRSGVRIVRKEERLPLIGRSKDGDSLRGEECRFLVAKRKL